MKIIPDRVRWAQQRFRKRLVYLGYWPRRKYEWVERRDRCSNCRFWAANGQHDLSAYCHFTPPTMLVSADSQRRPRMSQSDWCGQFRRQWGWR